MELKVRAKVVENRDRMVGYFAGRRIREGEEFILANPSEFSHNWMEAVGWKPPAPRDLPRKSFEMRVPGADLALVVTERKHPLLVDDGVDLPESSEVLEPEPVNKLDQGPVVVSTPDDEPPEEEILTVEEIRKMGQKDLDALVDENELDIKKSRSLKVYRDRIIQALEDAAAREE